MSKAVHGDIDLVDAAGDHGFLFTTDRAGFAGEGEALRAQFALADGLPSELREHFSANPDSVAFVCVPFDTTQPSVAVVPEVLTRFGSPAPAGGVDASPAPHVYSVEPTRDPKEWCDAVAEAVKRINAGELDKVVLAREVVVTAERPLSQHAILRNLSRNYRSSYRYAFEGFVGASPELLIERSGSAIRALPLAGTVARSSDPAVDAEAAASLLSSMKDLAEHRHLADMVRETLLPLTEQLDVPSQPQVLSVANVHHLATQVRGTLRNDTDVLQLVQALHPTPAVGGRPTAKALEVIAELEELDRGRYAGAIGWIDADGNGTFAVAIRCAQINGTEARLYAGNGIVGASDPERELEETGAKLQAMLSALVRP